MDNYIRISFTDNPFTSGAPGLSTKELARAEKRLGVPIPAPLVALYREINGGVPLNDVFEDEHGEDHLIAGLIPMLKPRVEGDTTLEETYKRFREEQKVLEKSELPFARDVGGNLFCLDAKSGEVRLILLDVTPVERTVLSAGLKAFLDEMAMYDD